MAKFRNWGRASTLVFVVALVMPFTTVGMLVATSSPASASNYHTSSYWTDIVGISKHCFPSGGNSVGVDEGVASAGEICVGLEANEYSAEPAVLFQWQGYEVPSEVAYRAFQMLENTGGGVQTPDNYGFGQVLGQNIYNGANGQGYECNVNKVSGVTYTSCAFVGLPSPLGLGFVYKVKLQDPTVCSWDGLFCQPNPNDRAPILNNNGWLTTTGLEYLGWDVDLAETLASGWVELGEDN